MTILQTTIRPGLLVGLSTSIKGNVKYNKTELESERVTEDGVMLSRWETEKTVMNAAEHEAATKVRTKARGLVTSVCSATSFGYLCPESRSEQLTKAVADARRICEEFNKTSEYSTVSFYVITGRVNPDDKEAVRAIKSEVGNLLAEMEAGVKGLDVEVIRGAAKRAKQIGSMLSPDAQARVQIAIDIARKKATEIKAAGEQAAVEIDRMTLEVIAEARTAFLDIDTVAEMVEPADTTGRAIDLTPEHATAEAAVEAAREIEPEEPSIQARDPFMVDRFLELN